MLDDAVFHLVKAEMVGVEDALGAFQVEVVLGELAPRQVNEVLQVVELYAVFRCLRMGALQLLQFPFKDLGHFLRPFFLCGLLFQLLDVLLVGIAAQLFLDGAQLLVEIILTLLLVHIHAHLVLDLLLQLYHLLLGGQHSQKVVGHLHDVRRFKHHLLGGQVHLHVAGHEIHQEFRAINALDGEGCLFGQVLRAGDDLYGQLFDGLHQSVEFPGFGIVFRSRIRQHQSLDVRLGLQGLHHLEAALALYDDGHVAVGHLYDFQDMGGGAHFV